VIVPTPNRCPTRARLPLLLALLLPTLLLALPAAANASPAKGEEAVDPAKAEAVRELLATVEELGGAYYYRYCAACHGEGGKGDGLVAKALQPPPADLTRISERRDGRFPIEELMANIDGRTGDVPAHGLRDMPMWGERLGDGIPEARREGVVRGRIRAIVEYLRTLQVR